MIISKDLTAASATPLALAIIAREESYGYAIIKQVKELSSGELDWTEGMLYPVLHRLEDSGLVESFWSGEGQRKRKYYRATTAGREALQTMRDQWRTVSEVLEAGWNEKKE